MEPLGLFNFCWSRVRVRLIRLHYSKFPGSLCSGAARGGGHTIALLAVHISSSQLVAFTHSVHLDVYDAQSTLTAAAASAAGVFSAAQMLLMLPR
jgi:hypothetical protein